jgi:hypothetical protein
MSASAVWVRVWPPLLEEKAMALEGPPAGFFGRRWWGEEGGVFDGVEELAAEVVHARAKVAELRGELVVADERGDGDDEPGGGGDEGFRDAGGDGAEGGCAGGAEAVEGVDDTHDGAEQADEGGSVGDGGEPGHARFHGGEGFGGSDLGGAFEGDGVARHATASGLALVLVVDLGEDGDEGAGLELLGDGSDFGEAAGLAEGAEKALALLAGAAEASPLGEHDGPGEDAGEEQDDEDCEGDRARVAHHLDECAARGADGSGGREGIILEEKECEGEWGWWEAENHWVYCKAVGVGARVRPYTPGFVNIRLTGEERHLRLVRMDSNSASPGSTDALAVPPPPIPFEPLLTFKPKRLRPVWVGLVLAVVGFFLYAFSAIGADAEKAKGLAAFWALPVWIYYFMIIHRIIRVLDTQPGWSAEYTPAAAIWKQFIPFYGLYFLYQWPSDVESYINWRLGRESRVGLWTFLGLITGILLGYADAFVGGLVMMASFYVLYVPLRQALATAPPSDAPAPGYDGTLGLR